MNRQERTGREFAVLAVVGAVCVLAAMLGEAPANPAAPSLSAAAAVDPEPEDRADSGAATRAQSGSRTPREEAGGRPPPQRTRTMPAITTSGNRILRGGQPWWFLGYNSFVWSGDCGGDEEKMTAAQVDEWFASMRHDGHGAVRLFFYSGWNLDRLDAAVASARRHRVYLTITLDDAIGGCGETEKGEGWFADAGERAVYVDHMTTLLKRYRGETAIAWFEFFNEPSDAGGELRRFYDEMGELADDIDPDRLFSSGTIAPYAVGGDGGYRQVHESDAVDLASLHEYDEGEVESNHGPGARRAAAGKPVIVGEFGLKADASGCPLDLAERAERVAAKVNVYTSGRGYVGAFAWSWQPGNGAGECELENLDADRMTQRVLRTAGGGRQPG